MSIEVASHNKMAWGTRILDVAKPNMIIKEKQDSHARYSFSSRNFLITHEGGKSYAGASQWIIRDAPTGGRSRSDVKEYIRELCLIFIQKIKEFEMLDHKATKAEQKQLFVLLDLLLEAQKVLHDEES